MHLEIYNYRSYDPSIRNKLLEQALKEGWTMQQLLKEVRKDKPTRVRTYTKKELYERLAVGQLGTLSSIWKGIKKELGEGDKRGKEISECIKRLELLYDEVDGELEWDDSLVKNSESKKRKREDEEEDDGDDDCEPEDSEETNSDDDWPT